MKEEHKALKTSMIPVLTVQAHLVCKKLLHEETLCEISNDFSYCQYVNSL